MRDLDVQCSGTPTCEHGPTHLSAAQKASPALFNISLVLKANLVDEKTRYRYVKVIVFHRNLLLHMLMNKKTKNKETLQQRRYKLQHLTIKIFFHWTTSGTNYLPSL